MSRHATAEVLSAYVDQELPRPQLRLVETHLEECEECREQLKGLRRVVGSLRNLEAIAPPPVLAQHVQRRIALEERPTSLVQKLEKRLQKVPVEPSVGVTFALVFAFAVILLFFADSLKKEQSRTTFIVPPDPVLEAEPPRELAGRTFQRVEDLWIEQGLDEAAELHELEIRSAERADLLTRIPELGSLLTAGDGVRLRDGGRIVEIPPASPQTP